MTATPSSVASNSQHPKAQYQKKKNKDSLHIRSSPLLGSVKSAIVSNNNTGLLDILKINLPTLRGGKSKNILLSEAFALLGSRNNYQSIISTISLCEDLGIKMDNYTMTTAINALIKLDRHDSAFQLFDKMRSTFKLDQFAYCVGIKAAGFARPWSYTMDLLRDADRELSAGKQELVNAALVTLSRQQGREDEGHSTDSREGESIYVQRARQLLDWCDNRHVQGMEPSVHTLDSFLSVLCKHGSLDSCLVALNERLVNETSALSRSGATRPPCTTVSFNIVLNRCARDKDEKAVKTVLGKMQAQGIARDEATANTLLKFMLDTAKTAQGRRRLVFPPLAVMKALASDGNPSGTVSDGSSARVTIPNENSAQDSAPPMEIDSRDVQKEMDTTLLVRYFASSGRVVDALRVIDDTSDEELTARMVTNALMGVLKDAANSEGGERPVSTSRSSRAVVALKILARCRRLGIASDSVYTATARVLTAVDQHVKALNVLQVGLGYLAADPETSLAPVSMPVSMRSPSFRDPKEGVRSAFTKYSLSVTLSCCLSLLKHCVADTARGNGDNKQSLSLAIDHMRGALTQCHATSSELLTNAICQRVMREIVECADILDSPDVLQASDLTSDSDSGAFAVLESILNIAIDLHVGPLRDCRCAAGERLLERMHRAGNVNKALELLALYCSHEDAAVSPARVKASHFNSVLRLIAGSSDGTCQHASALLSLMMRTNAVPSTYTIAQLVRLARQYRDGSLAVRAIKFALALRRPAGTPTPSDRAIALLPSGVVNDALSLLYSLGQRDSGLGLYQALYSRGYVSHWVKKKLHSPTDGWQMDLHEFSRGMAVAAMQVGLMEIRRAHSMHAGTAAGSGESLIVITGQSLSRGAQAFVLVDEIQRLLIEDYLPPIPSSTVPNNPGRLRVNVADILAQ